MHNSIKAPPGKPPKPSKKFPLFAHNSGMWGKKIRGRLVYFTSWRQDPQGEAALEQFEKEWPYLRKGETPPALDVSDGCTLRQLVNDFLRSKEEKLKAGELSPRSFRDYFETCHKIIDFFGKERRVDDLRPDDFRSFRSKLAERFNVNSLKNEINRIRIVFNYAHDNQLVPKPLFYGQSFDRPSALAVRRERNQAGPKLFEREELLAIIEAADVQLRTMTLLALNTGFGNTDCANLPEAALDLTTGWASFPRPKTEIARRVPLWPETVAALQSWLPMRPIPVDDAGKGLVFLTRFGKPWVRSRKRKDAGDGTTPPVVFIDGLSQAFAKILKKLGINGRRGLGFYSLRHCFETYAGESRDQVAVDSIMGHVDPSMSANYRHRISDERLLAVVETVRGWLFSPATKGGVA